MPFFVTGKIGQKRSVTPEGFVICHDVPLARTGEQLYRPHEVPPTIRPKPGTDYIRVMRDPEEVFAPDAIASAEGKPITINHPHDLVVTPATFRGLSHGHVQNVRRGTGAQSNLLLGDLVVQSQEAIDLVAPGLEVSMGYDCGYQELGEDDELPSGLARQHGYLFNHLAFVPEGGRCGPECAVGDHSTCNSTGDLTMATPDKRSAWDKLRAAFTTKDATSFDAAFAELSTAPTNDGAPAPVIVNVHGAAPAAATADAAVLDGAPDWFKTYAAAADKKFDTLAGGLVSLRKMVDKKGKDDDDDKDEKIAELKAKIAAEDDEDKKAELKKQLAALTGDARARRGDADEDDDEEKERKRKAREASKDEKILGELELEAPEGVKTGDIKTFVRTGDSAFLEDSFTATIAAAEILAPGIAVPTFDAKMAPTKTFDAICGLRRKALDFAMKETAGDAIVQAVTGGRTIDTKGASCSHVRSVFLAAVAMKKQANNAAGGARVADTRAAPGKGQIKTIADLNAMNEQFRNPGAKKVA